MGIVEKGLVSIIIPVFNRETLLPDTLDSILAQTYSQWECIIVDDGSTDASLEVAHLYASKDIRFKINQRPWYKKKGANTCRNYGFKLSKGEFIQWFDSDDIMDENYVAIVSKLISISNKDMVVASANFLDINSGNLNLKNLSKNLLESPKSAFTYLFKDAWFQTSQVTVKRNVIVEEGNYFDIHLSRNQEAEYFTRLMLKGAQIKCYMDKPLVNLKVHDNSLGGLYSSFSDPFKKKKDYFAYFKMFKNFQNAGALDTEALSEFQNYFTVCLRIMSQFNKQYFHLFFYGICFGFFKNKNLALKIFIIRSLNFLF